MTKTPVYIYLSEFKHARLNLLPKSMQVTSLICSIIKRNTLDVSFRREKRNSGIILSWEQNYHCNNMAKKKT